MLPRVGRILAALLLIALGGGATYLALSIPNDIRAGEVLKKAKADLEQGERLRARQSLQAVVEHYPRTDAAAAALHMLFRLAEQDRMKLENELRALKRAQESNQKTLDSLRRALSEASEKTSKAAADAEEGKKLAAARPTPSKPRITVKKSTSKKATAKRPTRKRR